MCLIIQTSSQTPHGIDLFLKRSTGNRTQSRSKICTVLFNASSSALSSSENRSSLSCSHRKLFKKYSFIFFEIIACITITHARKIALIEILLLQFQLKYDQIGYKNSAFFPLSEYIERQFPKAFYKELKSRYQNFLTDLCKIIISLKFMCAQKLIQINNHIHHIQGSP